MKFGAFSLHFVTLKLFLFWHKLQLDQTDQRLFAFIPIVASWNNLLGLECQSVLICNRWHCLVRASVQYHDHPLSHVILSMLCCRVRQFSAR